MKVEAAHGQPRHSPGELDEIERTTESLVLSSGVISPGFTTRLTSGWQSCPFAGDRPESSSFPVASIITLARI